MAAAVDSLSVAAYAVRLEEPESDGTLAWDATTMIVVEAEGGGERGLGYTYGDVAVATLVESKLADVVRGTDVRRPPAAWAAMQAQLRNAGRPGVGSMAVSAVDVALWDLKARVLGLPLADVLPRYHERVPVYGSGGFTSYSDDRLREELGAWAAMGIPRVKMKVGRDKEADPRRIQAARAAIGDDVALLVDGNGAYQPTEAVAWAQRFAEEGVVYFEEPVTSEDGAGLRFVREHAPAGLSIAAGEYAWNLTYVRDLVGAVDVMQADVTRVGGVTELLRVDGLCKAHALPFSAHCAPALSAHACCAMETLVHLEYFHDHVLVEQLLLDGTHDPDEGFLTPDPSRPGHGLALKRDEAERYRVR